MTVSTHIQQSAKRLPLLRPEARHVAHDLVGIEDRPDSRLKPGQLLVKFGPANRPWNFRACKIGPA